MCCITVLCAACKKEKPYEKFVGDYKGNCLIDPTITMDNPLIPGQTITQHLDDIPIPEVILPEGYTKQSANFTIKGLCPKCSKHPKTRH